MHLFLGLGNPGPKYDLTRHNIGFALADRLVEDVEGLPRGAAVAWKSEGKSLTRKISLAGQPLLVAKPQTFMNLSGEAAQALMSFYKIPPERLVVAVDEVYLELGTVRIRRQGSHGGHNGMRSLIQHCGDDFVRIRIGVGPCPPSRSHSDFVLEKYGPEEGRAFEPVLAQFRTLMETGLSLGWDRAASDFNRKAEP